jgi:hypothetical protein
MVKDIQQHVYKGPAKTKLARPGDPGRWGQGGYPFPAPKVYKISAVYLLSIFKRLFAREL